MNTWQFMTTQGHSLTVVQGHSGSTFSNFFSQETARPIEDKFHMEPPWDMGNENLLMSWPYMVKKNSKILFFETKKPMTWNLIYSIVLDYHQFFSNDDPVLTLTIFMTGSNLFPNASVWVTSLYSIECSCISKFVLVQQSSALGWAIQDLWSSGC